MSLRSRAWLVAAALSFAFIPPVIATREASAQQTIDAARARELFREATALMAAGDYASALSKLQQVASFKNTPQVRFNIGVCQEKLGRLVVALGEYRIAIADAEHDKKLKNVVEEATRAIGELEPRIPSLTLQRGAGAELATVSVDGRELTDSQVSAPILLDPGVHTIEATAEGYAKFRKQLRVSEREKATLELVMTKGEAPVPVPSASAPPAASAAPSTSAAEPEPAPSASAPEPAMTSMETPQAASASGGSGQMFGWIALGVGVAGGALATYGYLKRSSALSDLDSQCGADKQQCPASAQSLIDDGKSATTLGNVGLAVGLVGVTTGVILLLTSGPSAPEQEKPAPAPQAARLRFAPTFAPGWAGAAIGGQF